MTSLAALLFALPVAAISIWVAWSDMKFMKIPNKAVLSLLAVYIVLGVVSLPFVTWLLGLALGAATLVIGFFSTMIRLIGAGDAKFAAAMAPFFAGAEPRLLIGIYAACLLAAFTSHRLMRQIPAIRRRTEDWESWTRKDFPMGLALTGTLLLYLALAGMMAA